jgi:hypothetical protein
VSRFNILLNANKEQEKYLKHAKKKTWTWDGSKGRFFSVG